MASGGLRPARTGCGRGGGAAGDGREGRRVKRTRVPRSRQLHHLQRSEHGPRLRRAPVRRTDRRPDRRDAGHCADGVHRPHPQSDDSRRRDRDRPRRATDGAGGARVTGIDASEEMLAIARQRATEAGATIAFRAGDAHVLDFQDRRSTSSSVCGSSCTPLGGRTASPSVPRRRPVGDPRLPLVSQHRARPVEGPPIPRRRWSPTEPYRVFSRRQIEDALGRSGFKVRSVHRQFVLPIALHKAVGSTRFTIAVEGWLERLGLLRLFGSPVTVVAERCVP